MFQPFVFGLVPAPVRQGGERNRVRECFGKSLQPGRIHGETKLAVADGQGIVRVELFQLHIMTRDQRVPVNRRGVRGDGQEQGGTTKVKWHRAFHWLELLVLSPKPSRTENIFIAWPDFFSDSIPARKA